MNEALRERYSRSVELHSSDQAPEAQDAITEPGLPPGDLFLRDHPEILELKKGETSSLNRDEIVRTVRDLRVEHFEQQARVRGEEVSMSDEELEFLSDVLRIRVSNTPSPRELLDHLETDLGTDFDQLAGDLSRVRQVNARRRHLGDRYPSMSSSQLSAVEYLGGAGVAERKPTQKSRKK